MKNLTPEQIIKEQAQIISDLKKEVERIKAISKKYRKQAKKYFKKYIAASTELSNLESQVEEQAETIKSLKQHKTRKNLGDLIDQKLKEAQSGIFDQ